MELKQKLLCGLTGLVLATNTAIAETNKPEPKLDVSADISFQNKYVPNQGFTVVDNPVIQSSVTLTPKNVDGLSFNIWNNYNPETDGFTEVDFYASYNRSLTDNLGLGLSAGYLAFRFHDDLEIPDAQELGASLYTRNLPVDISLDVAQILGHNSGKGKSLGFSISKPFQLTDKLALTIGAGTRYNSHYFTNDSGFAIARGNLNFVIDLGKGFNTSLNYTRQFALDGDTFFDSFEDQHKFGVTLSKKF